MKQIQLPVEVYQQLVNYLQTCPYSHVAALLDSLKKNAKVVELEEFKKND